MKAPASPPATPRPDVDLDATAELPVLDPAEMESDGEPNEAADAAHGSSDTWILPPGEGAARIHASDTVELPIPVKGAPPAPRGGKAGGAEVRELEASLRATVEKLRDAEMLVARQAEQLRELEAWRVHAQAAHRAAEESTGSLQAELVRRESAGAQHTEELEAAIRARSLAEHHAASLGDELVRAREMSSALSEQVTQLQQRLAQDQIVVSGQLTREREQQQALTAQAQAHSARLIEELHLERARSASCLESLQTLEIRRQIAESLTIDLHRQMDMWHSTEAELRGRLDGRDSRVRELESELDKRAARIGDLERQVSSLEARLAQQSASEAQREEELQRLRTQRAELDVMLAAERDATAAAMTETAAREAAFANERARSTQLEESLAAERQRVTERGAHIGTLEKANEHWRTTAAIGREPSHDDTIHGDVLHPEPTADGMARLLIHSDDGREVVHVLGRKTSIGRTPDNDVQIDGRHISRHHAVILAGPATTLIEDLNSTNGVQVNGRRITRQVLQDGDQVIIGRTMYRFAVRRAGEPR